MTVNDFCLRLTEECGVAPGDHVLAAVSGGADSMALLMYLCAAREQMGIRVSCAHAEHGIRGEESLADMAFVERACATASVPFYAERLDAPAYAAMQHTGLEDAARRLRYAFLRRTAGQIGAKHIALAHHLYDQAETVLLHAARGCDVRGLCAMRAASAGLIRPLLSVSPQELRRDLTAAGMSWREDATNADLLYARNRIRHEALPALEAACPGAVSALARLAHAAQRDEDYFTRQIAALNPAVYPLACGAALLRRQLEPLEDALLGRVVALAMERAGVMPSAKAVSAVMTLIRSGGEAASLEGCVQARLGDTYLCITRDEPVLETALAGEGDTDTPFGRFSVRPALPGETGDGVRAQVMPASVLRGARVTARQEGDTIIPFAGRSPRKLKKMMIDAGIERALRSSMPVLRGEGGVIWAVGLRAAEVCRVGPKDMPVMVAFHGFLPSEEDGLRGIK